MTTQTTISPGRRHVRYRRRLVTAACFAVPALVLAASYAWLALDHGTVRLWNVVVHESGRYTLGQTVLYFSHFLREVPTAVVYALFLLAISGRTPGGIPVTALRGHAERRGLVPWLGWLGLAVAIALISGALILAARAHGWDSALRDLLQYRTRDDLSGYGTHWRYHWLSTLWFGAAAGVAPALVNRLAGGAVLSHRRLWLRVAWGAFVGLTLVFGMSADVFLDVRYAGHQAREILTHGPVTLLLGIGVLLAAGGGAEPAVVPADGPALPVRGVLLLFGVLAVLVPVYLGIVGLGGDVMAQGQTQLGLGAMVGAHYFEHSLDYMLVLAFLVAGLALAGARSRKSHHE